MSKLNKTFKLDDNLLLGKRKESRVSLAEQSRQRREAKEILGRLGSQPGVILADEVGMGKTFVALAVAYSIVSQKTNGPVVVMAPKNLIDKWCRDFDVFCDLYLPETKAVNCRDGAPVRELTKPGIIRYGVAYNSVDYLKLLDDKKNIRSQVIFLSHGSMSLGLNDPWIKLALIRETFKKHGRKRQLIKVKKQIHRFLAELLWVKFRQAASEEKEKIWQTLLEHDPREWKDIYNNSLMRDNKALDNNPVPEAVIKVLPRINLIKFAEALTKMPIRSHKRISERIKNARDALKTAKKNLWIQIIARARWKSPLLIMDEAHHLKNPGTSLARQLQCIDSTKDMHTGDGALSRSFSRMLFLTATPFQLGHNELVRVLRRFADVRWDKNAFGEKATFLEKLDNLNNYLSDAQISSIRLFRAWNQLAEADFSQAGSVSEWWKMICEADAETLSLRQKIFKEASEETKKKRKKAEKALKPLVIRQNKGDVWAGTSINRRERLDGAKIINKKQTGGITIPDEQVIPFFFAARSASGYGKDVLGEALCSSYEAFRFTRSHKKEEKDDSPEEDTIVDLTQATWFLNEFDRSLEKRSGRVHPKMIATVNRVVDLWEQGEKVIVFAFYRQTCRSLRIHISNEIERRILIHARRRLGGAKLSTDNASIESIIKNVQERYFDSSKTRGWKALDRALSNIIRDHEEYLIRQEVNIEDIKDIMRRFLRVRTTLVRAFPIHKYKELAPSLVVRSMLDTEDNSGISWREKFKSFLKFIVHESSPKEKKAYIAATKTTQTGRIRVQRGEEAADVGDEEAGDIALTLANVQVATGKTKQAARSRLMIAFNTPFFPDVLVCSRVMGEGIDLHRYCRHVIHHDLDWNPSDIEQRTGRVDRLGCKAEGRMPINVFLPYISGTADERQYSVMTEREKWFRIVMGQAEVAKLIPESTAMQRFVPPEEFQNTMVFDLSVC